MPCSHCGAQKIHAKGYCASCYSRYLKTGDPAKTKVKKYGPCKHCGVEGFIKALGFCSACYSRYLANGTPERVKVKKLAPCGFCGEEKEIKANGLCKACYQRHLKKGTCEYDRVKKICSVDGCESFVVGNGLCEKHYRRWQRHGHTEQTRPKGWGSKEKHELRGAYDWYVRRNIKFPVCEEWKGDFWKFVEDVGERPSKDHKLRRIRDDIPLSKENFEWVLPQILCGNDPDTKKKRSLYAKEYRKLNSRKVRDAAYKKAFGISIDEYEAIAERQGNRCAICGEKETAVNPKTGKVNSLSVDHCHTTGCVRGLLCSKCNTAIGLMRESEEIFSKATRYLAYHKNRRRPIKAGAIEQRNLVFSQPTV